MASTGWRRPAPVVLCIAILTLIVAVQATKMSSPRMTVKEKLQLRDEVVEMFYHGYRNYMERAFPHDEIKPVSCTSHNTFGGYSLTLIDSLDMLALIGDYREFFLQVRYIGTHVRFESDLFVSVFESTIRIVGGLLSAHLLAVDIAATLHREVRDGVRLHYPGHEDAAFYQYSGELLIKAKELADKLSPAFNTPTGIPYNEVHLRRGVQHDKGHTSCPAAAGSLLLEFGLLSHLTGNCSYLIAAHRALMGVWKFRARHGVIGTMIDITNGHWTNTEATIGASVDSFYEYALKAYLVFGDERYYGMWLNGSKAMHKYSFHSGWFLSASVDLLAPLDPPFEHRFNALKAFWPGLLALAGDVTMGLITYDKMHCIVNELTFMPEYVDIDAFANGRPQDKKTTGPGYPLRPEFIESTYFLYLATQEDALLRVAEAFKRNLNQKTRTRCGFAAILDVYSMQLEDKMDSFMLAETLKYLYLIFTPTAHDLGGTVNFVDLPSGGRHRVFRYNDPSLMNDPELLRRARESLLYDLSSNYVVNTEAHPLPMSVDLLATHRTCMNLVSEEQLSKHAANLILEEYTFHRAHEYEVFPPSLEEQRKQCPVVDYMRDVAPVTARMHQSRTGSRDASSCRESVKRSRLSPVVNKVRPHGQQLAGDDESGTYVVRPDGKIAQGLNFMVPKDPLDSWSDDLPFYLTFFTTSAQIIPSSVLKAVSQYGAVLLPAFVRPTSLFLPTQHIALQFALPAPAVRPSTLAHPSTRMMTVLLSGAQFGVPVCEGLEASDHTATVATPSPALISQTRDYTFVFVKSDLCPDKEGGFSSTLRAIVEDFHSLDRELFHNLTLGELRTGGSASEAKEVGQGSNPSAEHFPPMSRIALVTVRGGCMFKEKTQVAQRLGARLLVVANNELGLLNMADAPVADPTPVSIPALMIQREDAVRMKKTIADALAATLATGGVSIPVPYRIVADISCVRSAAQQAAAMGIVVQEREYGVIISRQRLAGFPRVGRAYPPVGGSHTPPFPQHSKLNVAVIFDQIHAKKPGYVTTTGCVTCTLAIRIDPVSVAAVTEPWLAFAGTASTTVRAFASWESSNIRATVALHMHPDERRVSADGEARGSRGTSADFAPAAHLSPSSSGVEASTFYAAVDVQFMWMDASVKPWLHMVMRTYSLREPVTDDDAGAHALVLDELHDIYRDQGFKQYGLSARFAGFDKSKKRFVEILVGTSPTLLDELLATDWYTREYSEVRVVIERQWALALHPLAARFDKLLVVKADP